MQCPDCGRIHNVNYCPARPQREPHWNDYFDPPPTPEQQAAYDLIRNPPREPPEPPSPEQIAYWEEWEKMYPNGKKPYGWR